MADDPDRLAALPGAGNFFLFQHPDYGSFISQKAAEKAGRWTGYWIGINIIVLVVAGNSGQAGVAAFLGGDARMQLIHKGC